MNAKAGWWATLIRSTVGRADLVAPWEADEQRRAERAV
jgi:hypothetical protein